MSKKWKMPGRMRWVALVIALPMLYVASFGPAVRGVECGWLPIGPTALIYDPLLRMAVAHRNEMRMRTVLVVDDNGVVADDEEDEPPRNWLFRYGSSFGESAMLDLAGERGIAAGSGGGQFGASGGRN